jgi:hypothetical protein
MAILQSNIALLDDNLVDGDRRPGHPVRRTMRGEPRYSFRAQAHGPLDDGLLDLLLEIAVSVQLPIHPRFDAAHSHASLAATFTGL